MISVIGIGPSRLDMTLRALEALKDAEVIITYKGYYKYIEDLVEGKEIILKGMDVFSFGISKGSETVDKLCDHFGSCKLFTFIEIDENSKEIISKEKNIKLMDLNCHG